MIYIRLRKAIALLISIIPFSILRVILYRTFLGYKISKGAKIDFGTIIDVRHATIGRARIARFSSFTGPFSLSIGDGVSIGIGNSFNAARWATEPKFQGRGYLLECEIGNDCLITSKHIFDVVGGFKLGERSWIAGSSSQFWTHGAGINKPIVIRKDCYVGSAVRFAPGVEIGDNCLVALGSVVTGQFQHNNLMIAGVPAKVVKKDYDWHDNIPRRLPEAG